MPGYRLAISEQERIGPKYMCNSCGLLLREAMQTGCGHFYCSSCLANVFQNSRQCKEALMQSSYTAEKKRKLQEVLAIEYMSPEESVYEPDNSDEESIPKLEKLVRHKFEWRSDELNREFQSLDRKADRARSQRAKRMMVPREEGDIIPETLHSYPKNTPAWVLAGVLQKGP